MKKKQVLWINLTTLQQWNRPAVGIVRVESEVAKYFYHQEHFECHYFTYCKHTDKYFELIESEASNILFPRKMVQAAQSEASIPESTLRKLKKNIKTHCYRFSNKLPRPFAQPYLSFIQSVESSYYNRFLLPRYYLINKWIPSFRNHLLRIKQPSEITDDRIEASFNESDWILTMGLDWDTMNLESFYRLKKRLNFKVATVCYDIIPIKYPHLCVFDVANHFVKYFVDLAWTSDHIFCISNSTKNDLSEFLDSCGAPLPPMSVIRLGDDIEKANVKSELSVAVSDVVQNQNYILFVSTIERRKNHETIYRAFRRLLEKGSPNLPQLVFVGMIGWGVNDFLSDLQKDPLMTGKVVILSNVSDSELDTLYNNCLFTVFPSLYEGWGLPVTESLSHGKFCLASNTSSIPEAGGDFVEYLDPWDVPEWSQVLIHYIDNPLSLKEKEALIIDSFKINLWKELGESMVITLNMK